MNLTWLYVLALYAVAIHLARIPKRVASLFFVLVLLFLFRPLTQDVVLAPADVIRLVPPWSEMRAPNRPPITKYDVSNLNLHDVPMQIVPWIEQVRESWRSGQVPLWNARAGSGMPLLANGQSTPLSPFRILTLPLSLPHALAAEAAMKLLLSLALTFVFCRRRSSIGASIVAALAYGFSTWMTTWLQFPIATAAAFAPGIFLTIDLLAESWSRRRLLGAVAMFTAAVLSGHPETIYNIALLAAAYGLWTAPRAVGRVVAASLIAALLCLPFLVPFAEAVLQSQRFAEVSAPRASLTPPYSDFPSAILLLQPRFFGELPIERPWGPTGLESICGFAGVLAIAAAIAVAIDTVARRRWRERETLYLLALVACIGVVLGWPGITEVFAKLAGHAPAMRMRLGICWFGALLVASAIDRAREERDALPLLLGTLAVSAGMLWLLRTTSFPSPAHRATAVLAFLPSLAVLAAIAAVRLRGAVLVLAALTFIELFIAMRNWNTVARPGELVPSTPLIAAIPRDARMVGLGGQLYPNTAAMFGLEDVRVHDPMAWNPYVQFLTHTIGWNANDYYAKWNDAGTTVLDYLNVKYVASDRELPAPRYRQLYAGRDGRVYENTTVLPRFFAVRNVLSGGDVATHTDWRYTALVSAIPRRWGPALTEPRDTDAAVTITRKRDDDYRLRIRAARPTLIVSSLPDVPGWRVTGGEKIRVNDAFVGILVDRGDRQIDVTYSPRSFSVSAGVALLTLLVLIGSGSRRRR